ELTDMDNKFKSIFDGLGDKLKGLFDPFKKGFDAAFRPEGIERITRALVALFDNIGNIAEAVGNIAQDFSSAFYDVITSTGAVRIGSAIVS
ncbi:hypothetical protein RKU60_00740, partial [Streptococcus pneumoniae]|nr:hypothetical protein [Streptococcus pneumoniae]